MPELGRQASLRRHEKAHKEMFDFGCGGCPVDSWLALSGNQAIERPEYFHDEHPSILDDRILF